MQEPTTKVSKLIVEVIRGSVRPVTTLAFVGLFLGALFTGRVEEIPVWLQTVGVITITFWFGTRPLEKRLNGE